MKNVLDRMVMRGKTVSYTLAAVFALVVLSASAEGTGPFGYPNLLANPDFENSTIAANSNSGNWGYFKNGKVSLTGWKGYGNAGVAKFGNATWDPFLPDTDEYFVYIQMGKDFADGYSYIEQTVTPETTGLYAFTWPVCDALDIPSQRHTPRFFRGLRQRHE